MPARKGLLAPQNTFLETIATRFDGTHSNFVLGNAKISRVYPIVYCSDGFCELTGYPRAHIMQKPCACKFLYGHKTDQQHIATISSALEQKRELKLEVILYKNPRTHTAGSAFWCLLDIVPIQDENHEVVLFLCSYKDITKQKVTQQRQLLVQQQQQLLQHQQQFSIHQNATSPTIPEESSIAGDLHPPGGQPGATQQQHWVALNQDGTTTTTTTTTTFTAANALPTGGDMQMSENDLKQMEAETAKQALDLDEFELSADFDDVSGQGEDSDEPDSGDGTGHHDKHTASQYSRRRSRAVLYHLSGHYANKGTVNLKSKYKLKNRMNVPEYKTTSSLEKQRFIVSHYGVGKSCWDWLILIVSFYVAIVVPYNATFKETVPKTPEKCDLNEKFVDIFVETVFVIDVFLNFRTTFVNRKGEVVTRPKMICRHYVRGWFVVDACAAIPFDLLCTLHIYNQMDRYSQYSYIILTLLMLIFSLLAHWCACIWYVIASEEIRNNIQDKNWKLSWIHQLSDKLGYNVTQEKDMTSSYVTALYFTTSSLTSVGFGNVSATTNAEKIFSVVIMLIGALMHAVVFGNVTALIRVMYARRSNYQTRLRDLKDFFRLHQVPKELQQRMSDYFQTTWSLNHGIETYEILRDFPEELRGDVSLHLHREVLDLPIFESAPQGFLKSLARHIESKFCCPTEFLIHRGDALNYLYLVCNGSMEVLQDNMVVAILGKGDLVGYDVNAHATPEHSQFGLNTTKVGASGASLLTATPTALAKSSSDLKALTYCDLKCIHISGLLSVLKLYPEFSDTFYNEIVHDLSFNLRESHEELTDDDDDDDDGDGEGDENDDEDDDDAGGGGAHDDGEEAEHDNDDDDDGQEDHAGNDRQPRGDDDVRRPGDQPDNDDDDDDGDDHDDGSNRRANMNRLLRSVTDLQKKDIAEEDEDAGDENGKTRKSTCKPNAVPDNNDNQGGGGPPGSGANNNQSSSFSEASSSYFNGSSNSGPSKLFNGINGENGANSSSGTSGSRKNNYAARLRDFRSIDSEPNPSDLEPAPNAKDVLRRRLRDKGRDDDWSMDHSYDGLVDRVRRSSLAAATRRDSQVEELGKVTAGKAPQVNRSNLKSAMVGRGSRGDRKPLLSFDLSRNTTAPPAQSGRRKSAGSISNHSTNPNSPATILQHPSALRKPQNYTSLTHINENFTEKSGRKTIKHANSFQQMNVGPKRAKNPRNQSSQSDQDIRNIDDRISTLTMSVNELRQELRDTVRLLTSLVEHRSVGSSCNSINSAQTVETRPKIGPEVLQSAAADGQEIVARSHSAASLDADQESMPGPSHRCRPTEQIEEDLTPTHSRSEIQTDAEFDLIVDSSTAQPSHFDVQNRSAANAQQLHVAQNTPLGPLTPISHCPPSPLSFGGMSSSSAIVCDFDNDSGRSSSSVNSSSAFSGAFYPATSGGMARINSHTTPSPNELNQSNVVVVGKSERVGFPGPKEATPQQDLTNCRLGPYQQKARINMNQVADHNARLKKS